MTLIRDEKELKQLYSNTSHSFDRTSGVLKSKGFYKDFIEAASANVDMVDEVNSISKLRISLNQFINHQVTSFLD
jgi:hypothetical protein